jgi:hypothetical protein
VVRRNTSRLDGLLRYLQARGVQRGFRGSSRAWFWIAVGAWAFRRVRRVVGSEPEVVFRGELKPGQAIRIDHLREIYGDTAGKR